MARNGDSPSQVELVRKLFLQHSGVLRGYIMGLVPDFNLADDVLHDVFILASEKADAFEPGTNFIAWTTAIARRKVLERVRSGRATGRTLSAGVIESLCEAAPAVEPDDARIAALEECLEGLPPRSRRLIDMRYVEDRKPAEIARKTALQVESVYVTLSRVRSALRDCVEQKLKPHEAV